MYMSNNANLLSPLLSPSRFQRIESHLFDLYFASFGAEGELVFLGQHEAGGTDFAIVCECFDGGDIDEELNALQISQQLDGSAVGIEGCSGGNH